VTEADKTTDPCRRGGPRRAVHRIFPARLIHGVAGFAEVSARAFVVDLSRVRRPSLVVNNAISIVNTPSTGDHPVVSKFTPRRCACRRGPARGSLNVCRSILGVGCGAFSSRLWCGFVNAPEHTALFRFGRGHPLVYAFYTVFVARPTASAGFTCRRVSTLALHHQDCALLAGAALGHMTGHSWLGGFCRVHRRGRGHHAGGRAQDVASPRARPLLARAPAGVHGGAVTYTGLDQSGAELRLAPARRFAGAALLGRGQGRRAGGRVRGRFAAWRCCPTRLFWW